MAVKSLTPQEPNSAGITPTLYTSASTPSLSVGTLAPTGDQFSIPNDGRTALIVRTGATAITVTIQTPNTVDGLAIADRVISVPANAERWIRPQDTDAYGNPMLVVFSAVTNVSVAIIRM